MQREPGERATLTYLGPITCRLLLAAAVSMAPLAALGMDAPPSTPTTDVIVPVPKPARHEVFGALAFTADGSFASAWKFRSKKEVEARVLGECAALNRGHCEVVSLPRELCAAIATYFAGTARKVTYAGAGLTSAEAEHVALERCNSDQRSDRKCQVRTVLCADGR